MKNELCCLDRLREMGFHDRRGVAVPLVVVINN